MFRRWRFLHGVVVIRRRDYLRTLHQDVWEMKRWIVIPTKPHRTQPLAITVDLTVVDDGRPGGGGWVIETSNPCIKYGLSSHRMALITSECRHRSRSGWPSRRT